MYGTRTTTVALFVLVLIQAGTLARYNVEQAEPEAGKLPAPIRQGPLLLTQQTPAQYYWYQVGAIGDSASYNATYVAANVTIKTVYDKVNNDAHSYWIGGYLSNNAFIQVGYLNEVSTTDQPYCCAWFYEYFPAGQDKCCPPVIGREGSAGPIGSWHTYSMVYAGNGVWSFYMDGKLLGSTPDMGTSSSGSHAPAAIAEVAQASNNTDVLGPAEFKDMWFLATTWQRVPAARSLIWYGTGTPLNPPPNLYGVANVTGVNNAFLAGSGIPQPSSPSPNPGPLLWNVQNPPSFPGQVSISFLDTDQFSFSPEWVSLRQSSGTTRVFYTDSHYPNYQNLKIRNGNWVVDRVMWHTVNVVGQGATVAVPGPPSLAVETTVSSLRLRVIGVIFSLPVSGASALTILPDTTNATAKTDSSGLAVLAQLPPGTYYLRITVPYGIPAITSHDVLGSSELTARVLGLAEMLMIVITPIALSVFVVILAVRRERLRAASMPTIPPSMAVTGSCRNCGTPLHAMDVFCPACKTSVKVEPSQVGPGPGP